MNNHILPQQDFFIYVPTLKNINNPCEKTCTNIPDAAVNATQATAGSSPVGYENWEQIALNDVLVVYACLSKA